MSIFSLLLFLTSIIYNCAAGYELHRAIQLRDSFSAFLFLSLFLLLYPWLHTLGRFFILLGHPRISTWENVRRKKTCRRDAGEFCPARVVCFYDLPGFFMVEESEINILYAVNIIGWNIFLFHTWLWLHYDFKASSLIKGIREISRYFQSFYIRTFICELFVYETMFWFLIDQSFNKKENNCVHFTSLQFVAFYLNILNYGKFFQQLSEQN